jgi:hypothetical protein
MATICRDVIIILNHNTGDCACLGVFLSGKARIFAHLGDCILSVLG